MPEDITVDKAKFDAALQRLIQTKPMSLEEVKAIMKARKCEQPSRKVTSRKGVVGRSS